MENGESQSRPGDNKPPNRFQVERVGKVNNDRNSSISTSQLEDQDRLRNQDALGDSGTISNDNTNITASSSSNHEERNGICLDEGSPKQAEPTSDELSPPEAGTTRVRHVSMKSNGDTYNSLDPDEHSHNANDSYRRLDTHNLKTFGKNTHEAIPRLDFYRQTANAPQYKRPTLEELHEEKEEDAARLAENIALLDPTDTEPRILITPTANKFGWIKGVLVRCLLNIWGVMLFLRLSWVVGQAGIGFGSLIILLSAVVTVITTLSMSAICTNGEVKGGGAYYMISRSLGPEFGGAIGIIFSLANAIAVAMYVVGFAENIRDLLKENNMLIFDEVNDVRIIGVTTTTALLGIAIIGMEWEARAQLVLLAVLLISIVDFLIGVFIPSTKKQIIQGNVGFYADNTPFYDNFGPDFRGTENFFSVFSVFFPAATGILAGANISGDLKNPSSAIPKGTMLAILISGISYLACLWLLGATVVRDATGIENVTVCGEQCQYGLMNSYRVMELVSAWGPIIIGGISAATLSSALASLVSAPKLFQAVCKDKIFPYIHVFARGYGPSEDPRLAYILTYVIAVSFTLIGDLNAIAPLISNFFLMAYALINYSCFDASLSKSPGWRPAFKYYNMFVALAGAAMCIAIMFIVQWWAALITFTFVSILYAYVRHKKPDINWGSSTQANIYKTTLNSAIKLATIREHIKNYRPQILVLSGAPHNRPALVDFANNITKGISLLVCGHVLLPSETTNKRKTLPHGKIGRTYELMNKRRVKGFYTYVTSDNLRYGSLSLLQTTGLGKFRPNILLLGFKSDWLTADPVGISQYVHIIHDAFDANFGVGILRVSKGFDISNLISEEDLINAYGYNLDIVSPDEVRRYMRRANPKENVGQIKPNTASVVKKTRKTDDDNMNDDDEDEEDVDFVQDDDVAMTIMSSKQSQKAKIPEINRFHLKQKKGFIDVWWLFDDGGLTLLIPHILSTKAYWQDCNLRVFLAGSKKGELNKEQKNMATLLSKFRIDYHDMEVIPSFGKAPSEESKKKFNSGLSRWKAEADLSSASESDLNNDMTVTDQMLSDNKERTNRHLRTRDLIHSRSHSSALIVLTMPVPRKGLPIPLYMSWLDCLTDVPNVPVLLLRGNQESVLTFYS